MRSITGYGQVMEEGKTKVKTLTREREKAAAEVRKQESGLAAAKAVLEAKVIINVFYLLIKSCTSGYDLKLCGFTRGYYRFRIIVVVQVGTTALF